MSRTLRVTPEAEVDIFQAALWYESERSALGSEFMLAVREMLARVEKLPLRFPEVAPGIRRGMLPRFPFGVFFALEEHGPTVVAVMHLHRDPSRWTRRR